MPASLLVLGGLVVLLGGGALLVRGASRLAAAFNVPPLAIGLTVVAFGTSAPELAVSVQSALGGADALAIGNVVGSNIFNVLFILGTSAVLVPLTVSRRVVQLEVPIMIGVSLAALLLALDARLGRADGALLAAAVIGYTVWVFRTGRPDSGSEAGGHRPGGGSVTRAGLVAVVGVGLLVVGAGWLVAGAVGMARTLGVDEAVIGLTIVAAGTSLPEVATSLVAAYRGERDIAVGNVVGSNVFNLTAILGTTILLAGDLPVAAGVLTFDMVVMCATAVACLPIFFTGHVIARWEGCLFLAYYAVYTVYLLLDATQHRFLPAFASAVLWYALPLTGVTLAVLVVRERRARVRR